MAKRVSVDRWMFTVTAILVFIGLVMVFSASAVMAKERYGSAYEFLIKQMIWAVAGLIAMIVAMKVDYKHLKQPAIVFNVAGRDDGFPDLSFLSRPRPRHAPLVPPRPVLVPAVGASEARAHPISGLGFSKIKPKQWTTGATRSYRQSHRP